MRSPFFMVALLLSTMIPISALAEVVTIEVTIKSVDATGRTITTTRKDKTLTLDVSRKAEVTLNGVAGALEDLGVGKTAKINYETTLEIITKIEATGEELPTPELLAVSELGSNASCPWLSANGLTIYYTSDGNIHTAIRAHSDSVFENITKLFAGRIPTVTEDGLYMTFLGDRIDGEKGESVWYTSRDAINNPWKRPREIEVLDANERPCDLSLSPDGLTLHFSHKPILAERQLLFIVLWKLSETP